MANGSEITFRSRLADPVSRPVAPAVGRGDENDPAHKRQGLEKEAALEQLARLGRDVELLQRNREGGIPKTRSAVDGGQFRQHSALAVADDHHFPQGGVFALRVEFPDDAAQALGEDPGGVQNGVAGVVGEHPDLITIITARGR